MGKWTVVGLGVGVALWSAFLAAATVVAYAFNEGLCDEGMSCFDGGPEPYVAVFLANGIVALAGTALQLLPIEHKVRDPLQSIGSKIVICALAVATVGPFVAMAIAD